MLAALLGSGPAVAATLEVCSTCEHTAIQPAITAASSGDTVLVHPGTWVGDLSIAKPLTLQSTAGSASTKVQGQIAPAAITIAATATFIFGIHTNVRRKISFTQDFSFTQPNFDTDFAINRIGLF